MSDIRRIIVNRETVRSRFGAPSARPVVRAWAAVVIGNPFAGRYVEDLSALFDAGRAIGEQVMPDLVVRLGGPAVSYGKGALVGLDGEMEHGGACIHPMLGKPMRAVIGGGQAIIPSNVKLAAPGMTLDVPLGHKDDVWSFDHFDTVTISIPDAPLPDEIVVVIALADGGRVDPRCGKGPVR